MTKPNRYQQVVERSGDRRTELEILELLATDLILDVDRAYRELGEADEQVAKFLGREDLHDPAVDVEVAPLLERLRVLEYRYERTLTRISHYRRWIDARGGR